MGDEFSDALECLRRAKLQREIKAATEAVRASAGASSDAAVRMLAMRVGKQDAARTTIVIHPELVARESPRDLF